MNEYNEKKKEFLEYISTELDVTRDKLEELKNKLEKHLIPHLIGGKELGRAWSYVVEEKEKLIKRINYMEKLFLK